MSEYFKSKNVDPQGRENKRSDQQLLPLCALKCLLSVGWCNDMIGMLEM